MSRMKDRLSLWVPRGRSGGRGAGGADLVRCTRSNPCPKCGREKFCRTKRDGAEVWCTRDAEGAVRVLENELGPVYVHALDGAARETTERRARGAPSAVSHATTLGPDALHRAYSVVLGALSLDEQGHRSLIARGLTAEDIDRGMYRELPERRRAELARLVVAALGDDAAAQVPGIWWREEGGRGWWSLAGAPGLLVPVRDLVGRVVALKVRRRDPCEGPRYLYVTSSAAGGPAVRQVAHVPLRAREIGGDAIWLTEGELKADAATTLGRVSVLGLPGVSATSLGVEVARAVGARRVTVAFDSDWRTNPDVARHRARMVEWLYRAGFDVATEEWPSQWKGLDDWWLWREVSRGG